MRYFLTILFTALVTAWVIIGGNSLLNWSWENWTLDSFFSFGAWDSEIFDSAWADTEENSDTAFWSDDITTIEENILLCKDEDKIPVVDEATGKIVCKTAELVETECIWLDGERYPLGDKKTQYRAAVVSEDNPTPTCESAEFICINGQYVSDVEESGSYLRGSCVTINPKKDAITCEYKWESFLPGEWYFNYVESTVEQTKVCQYLGFYCNGNWGWYSYDGVDADVYDETNCAFTEAIDSTYLAAYKEELEQRWVLTDIVEGEYKTINKAFEVQGIGESCVTPWWEEVAHWDSVLSFLEETGWFEEHCEIRTSRCDDGVFVEKVPYDYPDCKIGVPESCDINGFTLYHDTEKDFYSTGKYVDGKWVCESWRRYCFDWEAEGESKYKYTTCTPPSGPKVEYNAANAVCPSPYIGWGSNWAPNQTWVWYISSSVEYGSTCTAVNLVCKFGTIRTWSASNYSAPTSTKYASSCTVWTPNGCTFNYLDAGSVNVAHGESVPYYGAGSVAYGSTCSSATATCSNGRINVSVWYKNCAPAAPAWCSSSCGNVAHGATLTTYNYNTLPYSSWVANCSAVGNAVVKSVCSNGSLSATPWAYCSCSIEAPAGCSNGMRHWETVTRFNDPGCSEDQFWNDLDGWSNSACQCKYGSITCNNWALSKTSNYPWDAYPVWSCR